MFFFKLFIYCGGGGGGHFTSICFILVWFIKYVLWDCLYKIVNVNVIYYVHVCEQARWARSAGNSAIENLCIIIMYSCRNVDWQMLVVNQVE